MTSKIDYKTTIYRAIYYSGFDWSKISSTPEQIDYKLVSKQSGLTIYLTHKKNGENDVIFAKTSDTLTEKDLLRFTRLCRKIERRTKNLQFEQDIVELTPIAKEDKE